MGVIVLPGSCPWVVVPRVVVLRVVVPGVVVLSPSWFHRPHPSYGREIYIFMRAFKRAFFFHIIWHIAPTCNLYCQIRSPRLTKESGFGMSRPLKKEFFMNTSMCRGSKSPESKDWHTRYNTFMYFSYALDSS